MLGKPKEGYPSSAWLCGCACLKLELIYFQIFSGWLSFFRKEQLQVSRGRQPPLPQAGCEHSSPVPGKTLLLGGVTTFEAQSNSRLNRNLGVPLKNKHKLRKENQRCSITSVFSLFFHGKYQHFVVKLIICSVQERGVSSQGMSSAPRSSHQRAEYSY